MDLLPASPLALGRSSVLLLAAMTAHSSREPDRTTRERARAGMQAGTGSSAGDTRPEEAFVYSRRPGVGLFLALVLILTVAVPVSAKPKETTRRLQSLPSAVACSPWDADGAPKIRRERHETPAAAAALGRGNPLVAAASCAGQPRSWHRRPDLRGG